MIRWGRRVIGFCVAFSRNVRALQGGGGEGGSRGQTKGGE